MVDRLTKERRSWNMGQVRGKNTKPELIVRSLLHRAGFRFRLHKKNLPGRPDIVLSKYKTIIFVHGCFWHRHPNCNDATIPKTRTDFWINKFEENVKRDSKNQSLLRELGWNVVVVWECETSNQKELSLYLARKIKSFVAKHVPTNSVMCTS